MCTAYIYLYGMFAICDKAHRLCTMFNTSHFQLLFVAHVVTEGELVLITQTTYINATISNNVIRHAFIRSYTLSLTIAISPREMEATRAECAKVCLVYI